MSKSESKERVVRAILERPKLTRKEKLARLAWAVSGGIGTGVVALLVGVALHYLTDAQATPVPTATTASVNCDTGPDDTTRVGHQHLAIFLSDLKENCWQRTLDNVEPGDEFDVLLSYRNYTGERVNDVTLLAWLPEGFELVPRTTKLGNSTTPDGLQISDNVAGRGVNVGDYLDGANAWVIFPARMTNAVDPPCDLAAWTIAARMSYAPVEDSDWVTSAVVSLRDC